MKQKITLLICTVFIMMLAACDGGKYPLNGLWYGYMDDDLTDEITVAFADDYCFWIIEDEAYMIDFTFEKGKGTMFSHEDKISFEKKGNTLIFKEKDEEDEELYKNTKVKSAPGSIGGVWYGPGKWLFACVGNYVFIVDEEDDLDYGTYKISGSSGEIDCEGWLEGTFTIKGSKLILDETGYFGKEIEFSRNK